MDAVTEDELSNISRQSKFETILYAVVSLSLLATVLAPLISSLNQDYYLFLLLGLFTLFLLFYSYYTIQAVIRINELQGKTSYIGIVLFYTGFIAVLWSMLAWSSSVVIPTVAPSWKSFYKGFLFPINHPSLLYSGMGIGIAGILIEITNLDEFMFSKLINWFKRFVYGVYRFLSSTSFLGAIILFIVGLKNTPNYWPYSSFLFGLALAIAWIVVFNPQFNVKLWNYVKRNYTFLFNLFAIFFFVRALFEPDNQLRSIFFSAMAASLLIANYKFFYAQFMKIMNVIKFLLTDTLFMLGTTILALGSFDLILTQKQGIALFGGVIDLSIGIALIIIGFAIGAKSYYNIIMLIDKALKQRNIKVLLSTFLFTLAFLLLVLSLILQDPYLWWSLLGTVTLIIALYIPEIIIFFKNLKLFMMLSWRIMKDNFLKVLQFITHLLAGVISFFSIILIFAPSMFQENTPFVLLGSISLVLLLEIKDVIKDYRKIFTSLGIVMGLLLPIDYFFTANKVYLYISLGAWIVAVLVNLESVYKGVINSLKGVWRFIVGFVRGLWEFLVFMTRLMYQGLIKLGYWFSNNIVTALYLVFFVLLFIYSIIIIVAGDPFNILTLNTFIDRLSYGFGLIILGLAGLYLVLRKVLTEKQKLVKASGKWRNMK